MLPGWLEAHGISPGSISTFADAGYTLEDMEELSVPDARLIAAEEMCIDSEDVEKFVAAIAARDFEVAVPAVSTPEPEETLTFPDDILILICRFAPLRSFVALMALDKTWYSRCARERPWRRLVCRGRTQDERIVKRPTIREEPVEDPPPPPEVVVVKTEAPRPNRLSAFLRSTPAAVTTTVDAAPVSLCQEFSRLATFIATCKPTPVVDNEDDDPEESSSGDSKPAMMIQSRAPAASFFVAERCGAGVAAVLQSYLTWIETGKLGAASRVVRELLAEAPLRLQLERTILMGEPPALGKVAYLSLKKIRGHRRDDPQRACDIARGLIATNASRLVHLDIAHFERWDRTLSFLHLGDISFPNLSVISLQSAAVTHVDSLVRLCPRLTQLRLAGLPDLGDDDLTDVVANTASTLRTVILSDLNFGDQVLTTAFRQRDFPELTALHLAPSKKHLTAVGLRALTGLTHLRHLALFRVEAEALAEVLALPNLERLALSVNSGILADSFAKAPELRRLTFLKLLNDDTIGGQALLAMADKTPCLNRFEINLTSPDFVHSLNNFSCFPALKTIVLSSSNSNMFHRHVKLEHISCLHHLDIRTDPASWSPSNLLPDLFR